MKTKWLHRIGFISSNALLQILQPVFGFIIVFLVIQNGSKIIWGNFVELLLFAYLAGQIINWGSKEYLLRSFSKQPNKIHINYTQLLILRFPVVILAAGAGLFFFENNCIPFLFLWLLGKFLTQAAEPLIIYEKKFIKAIVIELISFIYIFISLVWLTEKIDLFVLLQVYSMYQLSKGILYFVSHFNYLSSNDFTIDVTFFIRAFPFFLLAILGFLTAKIDVYLITYFEDAKVTANYQIINSLLLLVMTISMFIYTPFTKNIYRLQSDSIIRTQRMVVKIGLLIIPISLVLIYFGCMHFYDLTMPISYLIVAFFFIFPAFFYGVFILMLFKNEQEKGVVRILFVGSLINMIFTTVFLKINLGIFGALLGSAIAQFVILFLVVQNVKRLKEV